MYHKPAMVQVCLMSHLSWDTWASLDAIMCMESTEEPDETARICVRDLTKLDYSTIADCAGGREGNGLLHLMGTKTRDLKPKHRYLPWVVVNGSHDETVQKEAETDLLELVCRLYQVWKCEFIA